ncbi:MlaD family protein [Lutibacter sp.]|uniref:MlaD family protein n=1 Tax=Lutibacter sp. TaxID=1925666 RepID=UPI002732F84D|nr:MlaD family protein [Lutibacter sp.]MDP3313982.1 MlaD family protein [Lutibacter sp.]
MKITREFKTGLVFVAVIALFIWGYNFLKGFNLFDGPLTTFYAEYSDVEGLNTASVVTINGVVVGKIISIEFNKDPEKRGNLIVEFSVENDFEFSKKSIAKIYSTSIMGGKSLAIVPSFEGEMAIPGDFLKGETESDIFTSVSEKLSPLQAKVENVIVNADSLLVGFNDVLDAKTRLNLKSTISQLNEVVTSFSKTAKSVEELMLKNEVKISNTLSNSDRIASNFAKLSDSLASANIGMTIKNLEETINNLNGVLSSIESGKGTLGKLVKDEKMYNNLTNASKELEELLREMKLHPKRFVHFSLFGKKEKGFEGETKQVEINQ